jgi:phosphoglycerate dehydrogenase-like enzyme
METINVLVTMPFPEPLMDKLSNVSPRLAISQRPTGNADDLADIIDQIDVMYTMSTLPFPENAPRLRWVQLHSAGVDHILDHRLYADSDVMFTTTSGIHAIPMAEYTLAQMLAFAHHLLRMVEDKATVTTKWTNGRWDRYVPDELYGATLGIVGYGSVGRQIARLAQTFGMKILALKRDVRRLVDEAYTMPGVGDPEAEIPDRVYPPEALHSFLGECDYVAVTVPLTDQTRRLIDEAALAAMKPNAVLINIARGGIVDEAALIKALEQKTIAGAALDVFEEEPLPADSPLWGLPNVIISPHIAGFTPQYDERATDIFAENLRRFVADEPLLNLVVRERDY